MLLVLRGPTSHFTLHTQTTDRRMDIEVPVTEIPGRIFNPWQDFYSLAFINLRFRTRPVQGGLVPSKSNFVYRVNSVVSES
jgi:hypothetical protein